MNADPSPALGQHRADHMGLCQVDSQPLLVSVRVWPHGVPGAPGAARRVLAQARVLRPHVEWVIAGAGRERGVGEAAALHPHVTAAPL